MAYGDDWGMLPQFNSIAGYGYGSPDVPTIGDGNTFMGGPDLINIGNSSAGSLANSAQNINSPTWQQNLFGYTDDKGIKTNGMAGMALGAMQGLGSAYMGLKQYGLAKDQLAFQKSAYNKNYAAQRQSTNTDLADRQAARVAANSSYESVGSYMDKNRIA